MGILTDLMTGLVALEDTVSAAVPDLPPLRVYPLEPDGLIELPAIYNRFPDSDYEILDVAGSKQDTVTVIARVAVRHTDAREDFVRLLAYADAFIDTVDPSLRTTELSAACQEHRRTGMRNRVDMVGEIPVICFEFPIWVRLVRPGSP